MKKLNKQDYKKYISEVKLQTKEAERMAHLLPKLKWTSRLTFEQWLLFQEGNLKMFSPLDAYDIRESRMFEYYFNEGEEVMLDESAMSKEELNDFKDILGKKGIIKKCWSDLHGFLQGSAYQHTVEFDGVLFGEDLNNYSKNYIDTPLLIAYKTT